MKSYEELLLEVESLLDEVNRLEREVEELRARACRYAEEAMQYKAHLHGDAGC